MNKKVARPRKIKVGEVDYKIVSRSESWMKKHEALGQITYHKYLIELYENQPDIEMVNTLIHELAHSIVEEYNIKFKNKSQEEKVVTSLTDGMVDIFKEHPNLLIWIYNKLHKDSN